MLSGPLLWIAVVWAGIHGVHALLSRSSECAADGDGKGTARFGAISTSSAYRSWLEKHGISVSFLCITVRSNRIAKYFYRLALLAPRAWRLWFSFGVFVGCALLAIGPLLVMYNLGVIFADALSSLSLVVGPPATPDSTLHVGPMNSGSSGGGDGGDGGDGTSTGSADTRHHVRQFEMRPLIPGVNVPAEHTAVFFVVVLINSVFHEAGHGIAAALHDVYIENCGMFVQVILPGAFVELHSPQLNAVKAFQQLRIFCAGIWHNAVLTLAALGLYLALPTLLSTWYAYGSGVAVVAVDPHSPLAASLEPGDIITSINGGCATSTVNDLRHCMAELEALRSSGRTGMCISQPIVDAFPALQPPANIRAHTDVHIDCCVEDTGDSSQSRLCFSQREASRFKCIPARKASESSAPERCRVDAECSAGYSCWNVTLEVDDMHFVRFNVLGKDTVLFLGPLAEFTQSVVLSDYVPRGLSSLRFPLSVRTFLGYTIALSPALAVLNAAPCWMLDGAHMLKALLELLLPPPRFDEERVAALRRWCLNINSALLALLVVVSFSRIAFSSSP